MGGKTRKTGIDILGDVPWGTHFCQFYNTKKDLIDILIPYFKAGLENNEFCMWITSEPLSEKEAKKAMREALPDFDRYQKKGQIEILPHEEWYLKEGAFNTQRVLKGWVDKLDQALAQGYDGLRLTGNTFWLEKKDWRNYTEYEKEINNVIGKYRMMAICSYSLDKCEAAEVIDVVSNHQFALIRKKGKWTTIESSERRRSEEALERTSTEWKTTFDSVEDLIMLLDSEYRIIRANISTSRFLHLDFKEIIGKKCSRLFHKMDFPPEICPFRKMKHTKKAEESEVLLSEKGVWISASASPVLDDKKNLIGAVCIIKDITDRKLAEDALRENEENYRQLTDSISDVFFEMDKNLLCTY